MIMVEIFVPMFDIEYDFNVDEDSVIGMLIEEIAEMVSRHEQCILGDNIKQFVLCDEEKQIVLDKGKNLRTYGITNGSRLILV